MGALSFSWAGCGHGDFAHRQRSSYLSAHRHSCDGSHLWPAGALVDYIKAYGQGNVSLGAFVGDIATDGNQTIVCTYDNANVMVEYKRRGNVVVCCGKY